MGKENISNTSIGLLDYLALGLAAIGFVLYLCGIGFPDYSLTFFLYGLISLILAAYPVYKFLAKITSSKQIWGGVWIACLVSFFSFHVFYIFKTPDEYFISSRFRILKGQSGKKTMNTGAGMIEQFSPPAQARRDIRIVGIKTETYDKIKGEWPIHWSYYSKLIDIFKNPSNILFIDIFFIDPKPGQMEQVAKSLQGKPNVLLDYPAETTIASKNTIDDLEKRTEILRKYKLTNVIDTHERNTWLELAIPPVPMISTAAGGLGFANIRRDGDAINRKMPLVAKIPKHGPNQETEYFPSIDLLTVCKYYGVDPVQDVEVVMGKYLKIKNIPKTTIKDPVTFAEKDIMTKPNEKREIVIPIDEFGQMEINFVGGLFCFQDEELYDMAVDWDVETMENFQKHIFMLAMYYATGSGTAKDTHLSPYGEMSGIEHHAHAINTILNQDFLKNTSLWVNLAILLSMGMILGYVQPKFPIYIGFLFFSILALGYTGVTFYAFKEWSLVLPQPSVYVNLIIIFVTVIGFKILTEEENVKYIRSTFSKFVSRDVVDELLKDPDKIALGGARREVTVFFSDVRGFTTLSEALTPEELVQLLNEYLSVMTDIIIDMRGTIDKYMGDAIMAFWGAPIALEDHAFFACATAVKQIEQLKILQENWKSRNLPNIDIGIGLNSGFAVVGNMGSSHRMDYTCMGDTVNLGSRLEGSNKLYGTRIIISEYTYEKVKDRVLSRELDLVQVKGKTHPVRIYELVGLKEEFDMSQLIKPKVIQESDLQ